MAVTESSSFTFKRRHRERAASELERPMSSAKRWKSTFVTESWDRTAAMIWFSEAIVKLWLELD